MKIIKFTIHICVLGLVAWLGINYLEVKIEFTNPKYWLCLFLISTTYQHYIPIKAPWDKENTKK